METLQKWAGVLAVVAIVIAIIGWSLPKMHAKAPAAGGMTNYDGVTIIPAQTGDGLKVGSTGTTLVRMNSGTCTINAAATTIVASSSAVVSCYNSSGWSTVTGLTGVVLGDSCTLTLATSSKPTFGSISIAAASASSTSGVIDAIVQNNSGGTFTWTGNASSSATYQCLDF